MTVVSTMTQSTLLGWMTPRPHRALMADVSKIATHPSLIRFLQCRRLAGLMDASVCR